VTSQATEIFDYVWALIEKPDRTPRETELMIHGAHASRFLWEQGGTPLNQARGELLVSRAYAVAGRPGPALHHAALSLEIADAAELEPFDLASAHEAIARAYAIAGQVVRAREHEQIARGFADEIEDEEERDVVLSDLETLPIDDAAG
jgi:hypothetical protein